jgi:HDOD domain
MELAVSAATDTAGAQARIISAFNALRVIDRRNSTASDVAEALERDPALSAQLLRMARSPLFGVRSDDLAIGRAVVLLGFLSVRKMTVLHVCRLLSSSGGGDPETSDRWKRALWRGIAAEQLALRIDDTVAADSLMSGIMMSFSADVEKAGLSAETPTTDPQQQRRIKSIVAVSETIAEKILHALPGLPSTSDIDDCLSSAGFGRLEDGRLAVDIRRNHDLYASLFS